jgi:DNA polymerase III alpha subunit (gram-positive type)
MDKKIFCITDFETTGVDPEKDFPIEVGCIFTDQDFNIIDSLDILLKPYENNLWFTLDAGWKEEYIPAYNIHKITPPEILNRGISFSDAAIQIIKKVSDIKNKIGDANLKPILLSDNAYFEMAFMKKLFKLGNFEDKFPFHYCAYDTNLSLCVFSNIVDPKCVHRAMNDVALLYKNILKYRNQLNVK